jgi:hypothetical protein
MYDEPVEREAHVFFFHFSIYRRRREFPCGGETWGTGRYDPTESWRELLDNAARSTCDVRREEFYDYTDHPQGRANATVLQPESESRDGGEHHRQTNPTGPHAGKRIAFRGTNGNGIGDVRLDTRVRLDTCAGATAEGRIQLEVAPIQIIETLIPQVKDQKYR